MMARTGLAALAAAAVLGSVSIALARPGDAARVMTGFVSHTVCSKVFVSRRDPEQVYAEMTEATAGAWLVGWGLDVRVDRARGQVETTLFGGARARAQFYPGIGCMLEHGASAAWVASAGMATNAKTLEPPVETRNPVIAAALERVFAEDGSTRKNTKAVVVMKDGRIIAERYAQDHGTDTPILGFSATKSIINALTGILVRDGRLKLDAPAPIAQWQTPGDPRGAITLNHLIRHTAGLALGSSLMASLGSAWDPVNRMKFIERDMAAFAADAKLETEPGSTWNYHDGNTVLQARIVTDAVGGKPADVLRFAQRELFGPLGMRHVTMEFDAAGTPEGSSQMLASARDWARFGQLFADDGMVGEQRILPRGWVDYSASPTPGAFVGYGAGFWTNRDDSFGAQYRIKHGMPREAFMAKGQFGQYVVVVPSERLVVARFGVTGGMNDVEGVSRFVREVIEATRDEQARR
jgi:CubicO group peptidase (beta-lactamase class C family)